MAAHTGTSVGGTTIGSVKRPFDFSVSDFATIVTTTAYVDKSLMLRDVYNASSRILITAPPRFGKSTNLDMVKRFFEVEVDARGNAKPVQTTINYKLFKDYNLAICKDVDFFKEHFGKHPVVHIGFKPLGCVVKSSKRPDAIKTIVKYSLDQHNYILQHSLKEQVFNGITGFDENCFRKYVSDEIFEDVGLDEVKLANSFTYLAIILKRFFGKKVYVLIDSYDAFLDSPLCENSTDREKMMSFVESSIGQLLNNTNCIERVFITGVIPVIFEGFLSSENKIEFYYFLGSHPFTKYYGLTSYEVDTVLIKVIECEDERRDMRNAINDYYNAYETRNRELRVYNVWSVLQYVWRREVESYWCDQRYINKFKKCFKIKPIREKLEGLLFNNEMELDVSQPLSVTDVLKENRMIKSYQAYSEELELFSVLLYHFGYLSIIKVNYFGIISLKIPCEEISSQLVKAVFDENRGLYSNSCVNGILSALDAFRPDANELEQNCQKFRNAISFFCQENSCKFSYILSILFINLVTRTTCRSVMGRKLGPDGPTAILLKNKHQVVICVTCDDRQTAENTHQRVTNDAGVQHIFEGFNDVHDKVIIAIGYFSGYSCKIAYSYYFKTDDNLREVRCLPNNGNQ